MQIREHYDDKRFIFRATAEAGKAAEYVMALQKQGWRDSNPQQLASKARALPLSYTLIRRLAAASGLAAHPDR